jgi:hypothetical protein
MWPGLWPGSTGPDSGPNWKALGYYSYLTIARCTGVPKSLLAFCVVLRMARVYHPVVSDKPRVGMGGPAARELAALKFAVQRAATTTYGIENLKMPEAALQLNLAVEGW